MLHIFPVRKTAVILMFANILVFLFCIQAVTSSVGEQSLEDEWESFEKMISGSSPPLPERPSSSTGIGSSLGGMWVPVVSQTPVTYPKLIACPAAVACPQVSQSTYKSVGFLSGASSVVGYPLAAIAEVKKHFTEKSDLAADKPNSSGSDMDISSGNSEEEEEKIIQQVVVTVPKKSTSVGGGSPSSTNDCRDRLLSASSASSKG